jgi:hypothetical protein
LDNNASSVSGNYNINVNGSDKNIFCDMNLDGGGWTLVASILDGYSIEKATIEKTTNSLLDNTSYQFLLSEFTDGVRFSYANRDFFINNSRFGEMNFYPLTNDDALRGVEYQPDMFAWAWSENTDFLAEGSDYTLIASRPKENRSVFVAFQRNYLLEYVSDNLLDIQTYHPDRNFPKVEFVDGVNANEEIHIYIR